MKSVDPLVCHTIGHGAMEPEALAALLAEARIERVVDVRVIPFSRSTPQFNKRTIEHSLAREEISYASMGDVLGGRMTDPGALLSNGRVDYGRIMEGATFKHGMCVLMRFLRIGYRLALMGAEPDPFHCHRFSLVGRALRAEGVSVVHILPDGSLMDHAGLEQRLVEECVPAYRNVSLFGPTMDFAEALSKGYARWKPPHRSRREQNGLRRGAQRAQPPV
jgi:uncharacterized protein (DUF488 family)